MMDKAMTTSTGSKPADFKQQIYTQLKKAGVVSSLKSQLRTQLLDQLRKLAGPDALRAAGAGQDQARSMWHSALNCMVTEYLEAAGCQFTLSVFKSETDAAGQTSFSNEELCQLLRLDRQPQLLQHVQQLLPSQGCLALALLQALSSAGGGPVTADSACQTSSRAQLDGLKGRLLQLEDAYIAKAAQRAASDSHFSLEQQMAAYKKECDGLVEMQLAARLARFREVELANARQEAAAKCRQQLEVDRVELERIHADRLARLTAREEEISEKLRRQQRDVENIAYSQRQRILAEEERIRGMKAEATRQLDVQEQLLRGLEAQLKEREKAVSAREVAAESKLAESAELEAKLAAAARKEAQAALAEEAAALRGERVALEAERSRLAELRTAVNTDLAVARAQEDRLRSLESARAEAEARSAAHAAGEEVLRLQLKQLQQEAAALQQELLRAGAAAGAAEAAAGGCGVHPLGDVTVSGGQPMQLPQALRELGQWQRKAQQAELDLNQVTVERDSAQSRADELTLDLSTARREIAALQNQLSRQKQDIVQLKMQLSQANAAVAAATAASGRFSSLGLGSRPGSRAGLGSPTRSIAGTLGSATGRPITAPYACGPTSGGADVDAHAQQVRQWQVSPHCFTAGAAGSQCADVWTAAATNAAVSGIRQSLEHAVQQQQQQACVTSNYAFCGGAAGSIAGAAQESKAASSRIAQLSAADASMTAQLAEFRHRNAAQRATAARQLADLRAAAGSSAGGSSAAALTAAAAACTGSVGGSSVTGRQQQQRCRLSIPSEFDGDTEAGQAVTDIDMQSTQELQQYQQRRAALEQAMQPHHAQLHLQLQQQHHQPQQHHVQQGNWQQRLQLSQYHGQQACVAMPAAAETDRLSDRHNTPAAPVSATGVALYPLIDALAPGGVMAKGGSYVQQLQQQLAAVQQHQTQALPQQQQQQQEDVQLLQQQQQEEEQPLVVCTASIDTADSSAATHPASSCTELSFVQRPQHHSCRNSKEDITVEQGGRQAQHGEQESGIGSRVQQQQHSTAHQQKQQESEQMVQPVDDGEINTGSAFEAGTEPSAAAAINNADDRMSSMPCTAVTTIVHNYSHNHTPVVAVFSGVEPAGLQADLAATAAAVGLADSAGASEGSAGARASAAGVSADLEAVAVMAGLHDDTIAAVVMAATASDSAGSQQGTSNTPEQENHNEHAQGEELVHGEDCLVEDAELSAAAAGLEGVRLSGSSIGNMSSSAADRYAGYPGGYDDDAESDDHSEVLHQQQHPHDQWLQQHVDYVHPSSRAGQQPETPESERADSPGPGAAEFLAEDASSESGDGTEAAAVAAHWQQGLQSPGSSEGSVF